MEPKVVSVPSKVSKQIRDTFSIVNNTFTHEVKNNPKDRISIEIGDSKQPDFKPQVKLMRWDNEVNFSMRAEEKADAVVETQGKLIKYITSEFEVHQYELDPGDIGEDGGLEFEWVLPKKPATNVLTATIQTKELDFFYQPALTPEEIEQGASRPENVVGSYAVYHKSKGGMNRADGMEYKTGKAFHIYRPKVTDANGVETWGELNVDENTGILTVTIGQTYLDNAVYPVIVDPTFGYTSKGASSYTDGASGNDYMRGSLYTTPADFGSLGSITQYALWASGSPSTKSVVVLHSNLNIVSNGVSNAINKPSGWVTPTFATLPTLSASTDYVLMVITNRYTSGAISYAYYDTGDADQGHHDTTNNYTTPTNPTDATSNTDKVSIYATYYTGAAGIQIQVAANEDDSFYRQNSGGTGTLSNNANDVPVGLFDANQTAMGAQMRFLNVTIPQGATIHDAHLLLTSSGTDSANTVNSRIRGKDVDDATMDTTTGGFENPPFTTAVVSWDAIAAWTDGSRYQSPDIASIVQEIVDRAGWASGNDMVIIWEDMEKRTTQSDNTLRRARSYNNVPADAPILLVSYTEGGGSSPTASAFMTTRTKFWGM